MIENSIIKAVVVDFATGKTLQRVGVPLAEMLDDSQLSAGRRFIVYDGDENINEVETTLIDGQIVFVPKSPDPDTDLAVARAAKFMALSTEFHHQVDKGCDSPKGRTACDDQAGMRVTGLIRLLEEMVARDLAPPSYTIDWTMFDRSLVPHNLEEFKTLGVAIGMGFQAKFATRQAIEALLLAATDLAELDAIDITAGWPA